MEKLRERYFKWLCGLVGLQDRRGRSWFTLARWLMDEEFIFRLEQDWDRARDGLQLRFLFASDVLGDRDRKTFRELYSGEGCRVLEMLVAFSMRIDDWLYGAEDNRAGTRRWFFEMLFNLGIEGYDDGYLAGMDGRNGRDDVLRRLDIWMNRTHRRDGRGGLFPLRSPNRDQRDVDIWYQLQNYLRENYKLVGEDKD